MIALITIIVYNSVVVFSMLPPGPYKETRLPVANIKSPVLEDTQPPSNVYMHLFVDNNQEVDLNNFMPYIDIIANKYSDFKYHLIVVLNDTVSEISNFSAEENNEIALNLLWAKNSVHHPQKDNIIIEHITLSKYMNNSPLRQHWKKLPKKFTEFLARAVSIWDKGGIAFNPVILTPRSPHAVYIEKIQNILKNYHHASKNNVIDRKVITKPHYVGIKKKVNNIRDIIDALEHDEEDAYNLPLEITTDIENKHNARETNNHNPAHSSIYSPTNEADNYPNINPKFSNILKNKSLVDVKISDTQESMVMAESSINNVSAQYHDNNNTSEFGLFPKFLELLFRNTANVAVSANKMQEEQMTATRKRKHATYDDFKINKSNLEQSFEHIDRKLTEKLKPLIISAKTIHDSDKIIEVNKDMKQDQNNQLTIDLKGNIVSSGIPCHAFLGTMFGNAIHHTQESLTDFIITELSIFCKGALSSCKGIDVILL